MVNKKSLLLIVCGIFLVFCSYGVFATTTLVSPIANGNYSTLIFNCTTDVVLPLNATLYYNAAGGAATTALVTVENDSVGYEFNDTSVDIAGLSDLSTYNFTCAVSNSTGTEYSSAVASVTLDSTSPSVVSANISSPVDGGGYNSTFGILTLNVSVSDAIMGVESVYFNITNSSGGQFGSILSASNLAGNYWNASLNVSALSGTTYEGTYYYTVWANDTLGNLNNSAYITARLDNTAPSSIILARTDRGASSLELSITIVDTVGIFSSCTVTGGDGGASVSGTDLTQTITESSLNCERTYDYIATCTDSGGNSNSSLETSFRTSTCGTSSTTTGSTTTVQWTNTYVVTDDNFKEGYSKELSAKQRMKISVGAQSHYVGVKELTTTSATIEITSDPVTVILEVGEERKLDLTDDGFYDLRVNLLGIANNKADIKILEIHEEIPEGEGAVSGGTAETTTAGSDSEDEEPGEKGGLMWLWILLGILLVSSVAGTIIVMKRNRLAFDFKQLSTGKFLKRV